MKIAIQQINKEWEVIYTLNKYSITVLHDDWGSVIRELTNNIDVIESALKNKSTLYSNTDNDK